MGNNCTTYCSVISLFGIFYLFGVGWALMKDYRYIPISDKQTSGWNCIYTGLAYVVVLLICLIVRAVKNKKESEKPEAPEELQMMMMKQEPNPAFDSADNKTSLLTK
mmetsp:Transcript_3420/g.459  ORF Transcript_3420/g.459 Transcript_3420/m.459 type:complete len:107 (+) Transcript_3420:22-342(+)